MGCSIEEARNAQEKAKKLFSQYGSVFSVGITRNKDGFGLKVNLESEISSDAEIPISVDGVPVELEVVGKIHKSEI